MTVYTIIINITLKVYIKAKKLSTKNTKHKINYFIQLKKPFFSHTLNCPHINIKLI